MKSYLRFLSRNKLYTAIEVVGLSLALAFVIPMICFYTNVARISKGHENYKNIYSLCVDHVQVSSPGFGDFLKERVPEIAIRKIFGGTIETETVRNIKAYMKIVLIADIIALPLIYLLLSRLSLNSVVKVGNTFWIYASAIAMSFVIAILAVLWQTLRAARTNPAEALKKE